MFLRFIICLLSVVLLSACIDAEETFLIENATIYDGSGDDAFVGDVRVKGDRILEVGQLKPNAGEKTISGEGMALSPGFIDLHNHHDQGLAENPSPYSALGQGITTMINGVDGVYSFTPGVFKSVKDILDEYDQNPAAMNMAAYSPHNSLRTQVMGYDYMRTATPEELEKMKQIVAADMAGGALGLSTGLEYEPGLYADTDEVIELAKIAGKAGGGYSSHIRSEDIYFWPAIEEFLTIVKTANLPGHVSHIKVAMFDLWGSAPKVLEKLDAARAEDYKITADIYPYNGWQSFMEILLPKRDYDNRASYEFALSKIAAPETIIITNYQANTAYHGRTLKEIAETENLDPVDMMIKMIKTSHDNDFKVGVIGRNISEDDIAVFMQWPYTTISSDGGIDDSHPRGQGSFPRAIRKYVNEKSVFTIENAVRKMTSLPAETVGIKKRGRIKAGYYADLLLWDAVNIKDHATFEDPIQYSTGIKHIWVNGQAVWENGKPTGLNSGRAIRLNQQGE